MLTKEQLYILSECIGYIDGLASMSGQTITITDTVADMLCDMSLELTRMRDALSKEGEETPLPEIGTFISTEPVEKKTLTPDEKQEAIGNFCNSKDNCADCPLFGIVGNEDLMPCDAKLNKINEFFDILVAEGCLTPDGKVIEED